MEAKSILQSKVFWFNLITASLNLTGYLPAEYAALATAIGNIALRFVTSQPVKL